MGMIAGPIDASAGASDRGDANTNDDWGSAVLSDVSAREARLIYLDFFVNSDCLVYQAVAPVPNAPQAAPHSSFRAVQAVQHVGLPRADCSFNQS